MAIYLKSVESAELIRWADLEVADLAMKQVCNIRWYRPTYQACLQL